MEESPPPYKNLDIILKFTHKVDKSSIIHVLYFASLLEGDDIMSFRLYFRKEDVEKICMEDIPMTSKVLTSKVVIMLGNDIINHFPTVCHRNMNFLKFIGTPYIIQVSKLPIERKYVIMKVEVKTGTLF